MLCYNLPVLQRILDAPETRALYRFPTKALANDQMNAVHGLIVVTNPDMLHTGILPHHTKWQKLFANLKYGVVDELHVYRGVFGL